MKSLSNQELKSVRGGSASMAVSIGIGIAALLVFVSGIVDGMVHPKKCEG